MLHYGFAGTGTAPGTVHIVAGTAGATAERGNFSFALGGFSVKHLDDYGYLRIDANRSRMRVQFVRISHSITLLPFFKMVPNNLDLRCVFHVSKPVKKNKTHFI